MKLGLIVIAMRQHGPHIAKILARQAIAEAQHLHARTGVVGFDIAGPERGNPPRLFQSAYEIARLGRLGLTAHAGEDAPGGVRLAGGGRAGGHAHRPRLLRGRSDPELMRRLARDRILVECCLSSNYHTGAVRRGRAAIPSTRSWRRACRWPSAATTPPSRARIRCARARRRGGEIGFEAVERVHRAAEEFSFIRPETALEATEDDD